MQLSDLGIIITGKTPTTKKEEFWNGDIPFVTPGDIQGTKHIRKTARYVTEKGMNSVKGAILPANAICVSCIGNIGYVGVTLLKSAFQISRSIRLLFQTIIIMITSFTC